MTTQSDAASPKPVKKKSPKFSASLEFSHLPPYAPLFAERVPVLKAFELALANYSLFWRARKPVGLRARIRREIMPREPFRAVECGVYTGSSLLACALLAREARVKFEMIGLDTFAGLPPLSDKDLSLAPEGAKYVKTTLFADTSLESVQEKIANRGLAGNVELRQGLFSQTLPALEERKYHFVNIDCDLYEPHLECLEYFYPRMMTGGIVFFDDYHSVDYPMAKQAVDEFMAGKREQLMHLRFGADGANRTKSFFVKY
jgi:hypothetical protein